MVIPFVKQKSWKTMRRAMFCVMVESTFCCDLQLDNVMPDVLVVTMPLSRLLEIAGMIAAMFAAELPAPLKNRHREK